MCDRVVIVVFGSGEEGSFVGSSSEGVMRSMGEVVVGGWGDEVGRPWEGASEEGI